MWTICCCGQRGHEPRRAAVEGGGASAPAWPRGAVEAARASRLETHLSRRVPSMVGAVSARGTVTVSSSSTPFTGYEGFSWAPAGEARVTMRRTTIVGIPRAVCKIAPGHRRRRDMQGRPQHFCGESGALNVTGTQPLAMDPVAGTPSLRAAQRVRPSP